MGLNISIKHEAEVEIEESLVFYAKISDQLVLGLIDEIESAKADISKNPLQFQAISKKYRKASLKVYPYKIIYHIVDNEILIVAFAHHKRKPYYWRSRK